MSGTLPSAAFLYQRVQRIIPPAEWAAFSDDVDAILALKRDRNAVILAHNYQTPEIFHCVADIVGDSLALARQAMTVDADIIVVPGVHFMAETAKLLNPDKMVLIPDLGAGCSLADSITANDVWLMRQRYPGVPVVTYVNTSAAVKAESDICCTSGNALAVVESLGVERVIMLPDEYLAMNVGAQTLVEIIAWKGHCEVHERFTQADIRELRDAYPGVTVLAHPLMPAGSCRGCGFRRLDGGDVGLCRTAQACARRVDDRMLDERQRRHRAPRRPVRAPLQSLSAHEAHHARQHSHGAGRNPPHRHHRPSSC